MGKRIEHRTIDGIEYKYCSKCREWKPLSEFGKDKTRKDGLNAWCKECQKQYKAKWDAENPDYFKQHNKQYYQANREEMLKYQKQYKAEHADEIAAYNKQYKAEHADEITAYGKQWRAERYATLEGYAYAIRYSNLKNDRKYGRCGKNEDPLPSLDYYIWALQQRDFYDCKQYHWSEMGLDRIYNDKAHTFANVVPCSTKNNNRRHRKSFEEFCELMKKENEELNIVCQ